jgi:hypothetical protein
MPGLLHLLADIFHPQDPFVLYAALDFLFGFAALYLFYLLAVDTQQDGENYRLVRGARLAVFLMFVHFPLVWVVPWQRPETLPTACFLALALFCLANGRNVPEWSGVLLLAVTAQSFVRSDIPFVFGAALFGLSVLRQNALAEFGSRALNAVRGLAIMLIAGAIQVYLQFVRYPHLSYPPGTLMISVRNNLTLHNALNGLLALLPFLLVGVLILRKGVRLNAVDRLIIAASVLYFPLWCTVGILDEVRVYVPFLMALCVVASKVCTSYLAGEDPQLPEAIG